MTDMRQLIKERADLAHTYACDGAYSRAAQILEELAQTVRAHHNAITQEIGPRPHQPIKRGITLPFTPKTER